MKVNRQFTIRLFTPILVPGFLILVIFLVCLFANVVAPYGMSEQRLSESLASPSASHWMGTDKMGRDIFSRILYGGRVTFLSAFAVVGFALLIGVPLGLIAGYFQGFVDSMIGRACDILVAFPSLLLALVFVAAFGRGQGNAIFALGFAFVPMTTRLVRSLTVVEKSKVYVEAAQSIGFSTPYILFHHILPNCISAIIVQAALDLGYAILSLAGLSFLGLGVQPPMADWGAMLDEGRSFLLNAPWLALAPGSVIVIVVWSINLFCDGVKEYLDPMQSLPDFKEWIEQNGPIA
jgi:peptide/nickel transport system permease protein